MLIGAYCVSSLCLWTVIMLGGGVAASCPARCTLIDSVGVSRALNFPSDGHFQAAVTWDAEGMDNMGKRAHLLSIWSVVGYCCYHAGRFFVSVTLISLGADTLRRDVFQSCISRCCMFGSKQLCPRDKLCFQYKRKGGESRRSVLTRVLCH